MANDHKALELHVLLEICRVSPESAEKTPAFVDEVSAAALIAAKFNSQHDSTLALITTLLASALGRLQQYNPTHLPFGYSGPTITSFNWVDRDDVERISKQIVGMTHPAMDAQYISFAVSAGVDEASSLGFLEQQRYDAWRPGMTSGSGWREAIRAMPYGLAKATSVAAPEPVKTKSQPAAVLNPDRPASNIDSVPKTSTAPDKELQNRAFKEEYYRLRDEIAEAAEVARKNADLASLLRQLIKEIELWTRELKHETLVLFDNSEHGEFARSLTGGGPTGMDLLPGYIVIDFMLTPWVDDLLELSLTEQQVKSFRTRMSAFNKLRTEFALAVTKQVPNWDARNPNYDHFVVIDEHRKNLKSAAIDFCAYIDTLAHVAASSAAPPRTSPATTSRTNEQPSRGATSTNATLMELDNLLEDANACLMSLAAARHDGDIMHETSRRMEGGGDDWHFASPADESNYRAASQRLKKHTADVVEPLNKLLAWGDSHGLEVYENADCLLKPAGTWQHMQDCECLERDVRSITNQLIVAKAKLELTGSSVSTPHSDPESVWLAAETIKSIAIGLHWHSIVIKLDKPSDYDDRDKLDQDFKLATRYGYLVASVARQLNLDAAPLLRMIREDRLWEYPTEKEDAAVFRAVSELAERVSTEARIWCAEAGIDPESQFTSVTAISGVEPASTAKENAVTPGASTSDRKPEAEAVPSLKMGRRGEACFVLGKEKPALTDAQYAVVDALLKAGDAGMKKDPLEQVRPSARRILTLLCKDEDWAAIIVMAGQTNGRYRIRQ